MSWKDELVVDTRDAMHSAREKMAKASREEAESIMKLAGFEVAHTWELANGYWPLHPNYDEVRRPWWLFLTDIGPIQVGWRKRVLHIEWTACEVRAVVTTDEVTKGDTYVHAWNVGKTVEYLTALRRVALEKRRWPPQELPDPAATARKWLADNGFASSSAYDHRSLAELLTAERAKAWQAAIDAALAAPVDDLYYAFELVERFRTLKITDVDAKEWSRR